MSLQSVLHIAATCLEAPKQAVRLQDDPTYLFATRWLYLVYNFGGATDKMPLEVSLALKTPWELRHSGFSKMDFAGC